MGKAKEDWLARRTILDAFASLGVPHPGIAARPAKPLKRARPGTQFGPALAFAALLAVSATPALAAPQAWTDNDIRKVADLAAETARARQATANERAAMLLSFAAALHANGQVLLARAIAQKAGARIAPPYEPGDRLRQWVEQIVEFGDAPDAERILRNENEPNQQMVIIGAIGAGFARAGDVKDAEQAAAHLSMFPEQPTARLQFSEKQWSLGWVASNMVTTDPIAAIRVAASLSSIVERQDIVTRAAVALCGSAAENAPRTKRGIAAMKQAETVFSNFRKSDITANPALAQDQERILGADTASAMAACDSSAAATGFVTANFTGHDAWSVLWQAAKNLTFAKQHALAHAIAPKPDLVDKATVAQIVDWLWANGDHTEARALAEAAQDRLGKDKLSRGFLFSDLKVGAYHAATSVILGMDPQEQGCEWPRVLTAELENGDVADARAALPGLTKPLRALSGDLCAIFVKPMFAALVRAGLGAAAQPDLDAYAQAYLAKPGIGEGNRSIQGNDIHSKAFIAGINAGLGRLTQALQTAQSAGPMTVPRNCDGPARKSFISCPDFKGFAPLGIHLSSPETFPPDTRTIVRGPKAIILGDIAAFLAECGNLPAAWKVEAVLEGQPYDAFREPRDKALAAIAAELLNEGDPYGAFAATQRIFSLPGKWYSLVALANYRSPNGKP